MINEIHNRFAMLFYSNFRNQSSVRLLLFIFCFIFFLHGYAQFDSLNMQVSNSSIILADTLAVADTVSTDDEEAIENTKVYIGLASFYADKFNGRRTASGEIFNQNKLTCACNKLPLGTRIRVTNIKNGKTVIVKVNDRLHPKMKRLVDLTRAGAKQLGYISSGLTKVKVEVLSHTPILPEKNKKKCRRKRHRI